MNLGSTQGASAAWGINDNHEVIGSDTTSPSLTWTGVSAAPVVGFHWTQAGGNVQIPRSVGRAIFPRGVNNAGVIVGTAVDPSNAGTASNIGRVFRFDPTVDAAPEFVQIPTGIGTAINSAGQITGHGYFPAHWMFRATGSDVLSIPGISGDYEVANAIDEDGDVFGYTVRASGGTAAVRYANALPIELLNQLSAPSSAWAADPVNGGDALDAAYGTNGTQVVGYGHAGNGTVRGFVLTSSTSGFPGSGAISQIPMIPKYPANDANHAIAAHAINRNGMVAGTVYDPSVSYPVGAFVWIDGVGTVDLNDFVDPASGWNLQGAFSINDSREVVGWGYLDGHQRAFKMTVPDMSPCSGADLCHTPGIRDLRTGACPAPTVIPGTVACQEGITLRVDGVVDMGGGQLVALFGYTNSGSAPIRPTTNFESSGGQRVPNPATGAAHPCFPRADFPGIFLPTFTSGQTITWTVDGLTVSASASSPRLTPVPIGQTGIGVQIGTTLVTLRGEVPPDPRQDGSGPKVGATI